MYENSKPKMDRSHLYLMQILFIIGISLGSQSLDLKNKHMWCVSIARFVVYLLTVEGTKMISTIIYDMLHRKRGFDSRLLKKINKNSIIQLVAAVGVIYFNEKPIFSEDFFLIFIAYLIIKYPEVEKKSGATVTYGTGMACSFIEGYLVHILPSDGAQFVGFLENIKIFESNQSVVFPVKRMFLIITKSMHCPPDLKEFNDKSEREDIARLEACQPDKQLTYAMLQSFEQVEKDVAGVKGRKYKNSAYKITRRHKRPVYIAAECATPLHTLYRVIKNRDLYEELADVDVEDIVSDFTSMLSTCLPKSPELKDKCELIYFDDTDPKSNLADIILARIQEIEPNFEEIVARRN